MQIILKKWFRITLLNLAIVALMGVVLRYKIAFFLPFIDQRYLLHGHSHFAFAGWITQAIMTFMVAYLYSNGQENAIQKYKWFLIFNLVTAYGMLVSFPVQGYGLVSILFSTLSIFVSYGFAIFFWRDLNKIKEDATSKLWFKAALIFSVLSSIGPFYLSYMMAAHHFHEKYYLLTIYFFLHFQYNGWFFFACMGLLVHKLESMGITSSLFKRIFWYFFAACIPAYFLSVLWLPMPTVVYIIVVLSAVVQLIAWGKLLKAIQSREKLFILNINRSGRILLMLVGIAFTIKLLLQMGSTHPQLSQIAFGFRPIVIGYLHLVLLGVITIFLLAYSVMQQYLSLVKTALVGLSIFIVGIILNEGFLMAQGIRALQNESITIIQVALFVVSLIMFSGIAILVKSQWLAEREG